MPLAAAAVAALDPAGVAAALREERTVAIDVGGTEHPLSADDLLISMRPLEGYQLEREGSHAVALETSIDDELRIEGWAREIVHAVQAARRDAGLDVSDRIVLTLDGDSQLIEAARAHQEYIAGETLAVDVRYEQDGMPAAATIDGLRLGVGVARADRL
jgi:isoleucyl-tRNA synthetase